MEHLAIKRNAAPAQATTRVNLEDTTLRRRSLPQRADDVASFT